VAVVENAKRVLISFGVAGFIILVVVGLVILSMALLLPFGAFFHISAEALGFPYIELLNIIPICLWWKLVRKWLKLVRKWIRNRNTAIYLWGKRPLPQPTPLPSEQSEVKHKKLIIHCPQCGRSLKGATKDMIGDTGVCPKCKAEFMIEGNNSASKQASEVDKTLS
jgi:hypothetical protein